VTDRRRLIVLRHAKAEPFAASDHDRRLTDRGLAAARDVGAHLREHKAAPDYAVVSSALRTRETWQAVKDAAGFTACEEHYDDGLLAGSPDVVVELLQEAPADAHTVMLVGHNPTAAYLCHSLDDGEGDATAVSEMLHGFPPGAVAVLDVSVPWAALAPETGRVVAFYVGVG
jgi:phosphohistidine phosphatase